MNSRVNVAGLNVAKVNAAGACAAMTHDRGMYKLAVLIAALVAALTLPLGASAHGQRWGGHAGYRGGYSGHYTQHRNYNRGAYRHNYYNRGYSNRGGYRHRGHWSGGRWIAGAVVAGAVIGLINEATRPAPVYYAQPRVVYRNYYPAPIVRRRVVRSRTMVYDDPYQTRYIRSEW